MLGGEDKREAGLMETPNDLEYLGRVRRAVVTGMRIDGKKRALATECVGAGVTWEVYLPLDLLHLPRAPS